MRVIEVKLKGKWFELHQDTVYNEDSRGYLIVKFRDVGIREFRPVEWRILED